MRPPKKKFVQVKAKRKTSVARAVVREGKGRLVINKAPLAVMGNAYLKTVVEEPLILLAEYNKNLVPTIDIEVNVFGGGQVSQVVAARGCVAKGIVKYFEDDKIRELFAKYDKALIVDDVRRKEAKKQLGRGARAKWQHSKR